MVRPTLSQSCCASSGVLFVKSGTVTCSVPCEMFRLIFVPAGFFVPAAGSWLTTLPAATLSSWTALVVPTSKPAFSMIVVASSSVLPFTSGTGSPDAKTPEKTSAAMAMTAMAATMATMSPVFLPPLFSGMFGVLAP